MNRDEYKAKRAEILLERKINPKKFESNSIRVPLPCIYRSENPFEWASCGCHVYYCDVHNKCVPWRKDKLKEGIKVCDECKQRVATHPPPPGPFTRHLMYHIYPVSGNGAWQRNVGRLVERLRIINGKRIVTIAIDPPSGRKPDPTGPFPPDRGRVIPGCDSPDQVIAAFGNHAKDIEFIVTENDSHLREVKTLMPMMERLPRGVGDVTLYAQAKATTRHPAHIANHWADVLYILYFDYWPLVEMQLLEKSVTGAFQKMGPGWNRSQSTSDWHYSGSWFWFRNADLFSRDWRRIDQFWSGIEPYISQHFHFDETDCIFHRATNATMQLYNRRYWRDVVNPAFAEWRTANKPNEVPF